MNTRTIPRLPLENACYRADLEPSEAIHDNYSGRFMYGARCFGLSVDHIGQAIRVLVELALDCADCGTSDSIHRDVIEELAEDVRTDNLGLGMIVYFPGFQLVNEGDDEEASDD